MKKIHWGILSTGKIAGLFAEGLAQTSSAELVAVGSRNLEKAQAFGDKYRVPHRHASYEALAADPAVDVIYVATPHNLHYANTKLCLEAGKPALVEKAFTLNAVQAASLISIAQQKGLFLMEAMWDRFLPHILKARELIAQGAIGEVRMVKADMGFRAEYKPDGRMLSPNLAGGALLDVGCYVVSFASMLLGTPEHVTGQSYLGQTGVDEQDGIVLRYAEGRMAVLSCAVRTAIPQDGFILGTDGWIHLHAPFGWSGKLTVKSGGSKEQTIRCRIKGRGLSYEANEVMRCLNAGLLESPVMPLAESLEIMKILDELRHQAGFKYPEEESI